MIAFSKAWNSETLSCRSFLWNRNLSPIIYDEKVIIWFSDYAIDVLIVLSTVVFIFTAGH